MELVRPIGFKHTTGGGFDEALDSVGDFAHPAIYKSLPFDPVKDFATISVPVTYGQLLAVHPSVPANNLAELVALAKQKRLAYATGGSGSPSHMTMAFFLATAGIDMTHIPYKGTGQSVIDVVAGQVETIFAVMAPAGTPNDIVQLLNRELRAALAHPDVVTRLKAADFVPTDRDPAQSARWLQTARDRWVEVAKREKTTAE